MSNVINMQEWLEKKQEETVKRIFGEEFWSVLMNDVLSSSVTYTYEDEHGELFTVSLDDSEDL